MRDKLVLVGNGMAGIRYDVQQMLKVSHHHKNAVVIGGGLLGLEAANGLLKQGMNVSVVHLMDRLLERQLDGANSQRVGHTSPTVSRESAIFFNKFHRSAL